MNARRILFAILSILVLSLMICATGMAATTKSKTANTAKFRPEITVSQANRIVLKKYPGNIQGTTKLENEEGKWEYCAMVISKKVFREVMVNATTGKIDNVEITTAAMEGVDDKADAAKSVRLL